MAPREGMKALLTRAFMAGVEAAHPDTFFAQDNVRAAFRDAMEQTTGRVIVLGAGKASAAMATALEREWAGLGGSDLEGLVVTRPGYETSTAKIEIAAGGHPYPAQESEGLALRMLEMARGLTKNDLLIGLWSGGGSALLACPPETVPFQAFLTLTKELLASGADIHEINAVRKHLSQVAGGRLAQAAAPVRLLNAIISDVTGGSEAKRLSAIASGPCVPDRTTIDDAKKVIARYGLEMPEYAFSETPKTWDEIGSASARNIVMDEEVSIEAAAKELTSQGYAILHTNPVAAEARDIARDFAAFALGKVGGEPAVIVSGGELTVTVGGSGTGGPNQEFALALAIALDGAEGVAALAGDTDGIDGIGDAAGAFVFPDTLERMRTAGIDPQAALENNDAGTAFEAIGDLLVTGPTFTNVNDLRLIVING